MKKKYPSPIIIAGIIILLIFIVINDEIREEIKNTFIYSISTFANKDLNSSNRYEMDLELDDNSRILSGTERVTYFNRSNNTMEDIYFHVYANAFSKNESVPVMFNNYSYAYPKGFDPCYIDIMNISAGGKEIDYSIGGVDGTILRLKLKRPIKKNEYVKIVINFQIKIPESRDRIGYYDGSYVFGNWYPIAAVYDDSGWNLDRFYDIGDPFYSDISDYSVNIILPDKYTVASTGDIINDKLKEGKRSVSINAKSVRDFAWSASTRFITYNKVIDGINIKCYFMNNNSERINKAVAALENSIEIFNEKFGKYPYSSFSMVESNFPTGMEYPGLVLIPDSYFNDNKSMLGLEGVIVHETAHQWWYSAVGNNEIDEAWLDESLATYSKVIYFEILNGMTFGRNYYEENILSVYNSKRKSIKEKEIILKPIYEFNDWKEYDTLVYKKGAVFLDTIRHKIGDDKFFAILRAYYNDYKFKNADTKNFINTVEKITNNKWDVFFSEWLSSKS